MNKMTKANAFFLMGISQKLTMCYRAFECVSGYAGKVPKGCLRRLANQMRGKERNISQQSTKSGKKIKF